MAKDANGSNGLNIPSVTKTLDFTPMHRAGDIIEMDPEKIEMVEGKDHPLYDPSVKDAPSGQMVIDVTAEGCASLLWVVEVAPGKLRLVAGRKRLKALRVAKEKANCLVLDPARPDYYLIKRMIVENELRSEDNPINRARKAQRAIAAGLELFRPIGAPAVENDEDGNVIYNGEGWRPDRGQRRAVIEDVAKAFNLTAKRIEFQLLPLLTLSPKVQRYIEEDKLSATQALEWKDKTHERQDALADAAVGKRKEPATRAKPGKETPKLTFNRTELQLARENISAGMASAPKPFIEFLEVYLGAVAIESAPRWIQKLFGWEPEAVEKPGKEAKEGKAKEAKKSKGSKDVEAE